MVVKGGLPMVMKKSAGVADLLVMVCRSVEEDNLMLSIVIRFCFVYGFCLI